MGCGVSRMSDLVEANYSPSEDEPFMNERQKSYFRAKLTAWKSDILREARETLEILQQENANHPDLADRARPKPIGRSSSGHATASAS